LKRELDYAQLRVYVAEPLHGLIKVSGVLLDRGLDSISNLGKDLVLYVTVTVLSFDLNEGEANENHCPQPFLAPFHCSHGR
jgi:hypothetical protein